MPRAHWLSRPIRCVIVEIVDPSTGRRVPPGQAGEVVATVNSPTYPLLRFGTGDLSALDAAACACGRTSPQLTGILGRVGDAVKVRGMFVHPRQLASVLARFPTISRYQAIVQHADQRDQFQLRLAASEVPLGLAEQLREVLRVRAELELVAPGAIAEDARPLVDLRTWGGRS
jgi:phenylacetate-CoA ligase